MSELDLSRYDAAVVEHLLLGAARARMFDDVAANQPWSVDLAVGTLTIAGRARRTQILGTFSKGSRTFLWAWANQGAAGWEASLGAARSLRALAAEKGYAAFAEREVAERWVSPRELALVCGELTGGHPTYFADAGAGIAILLVGDTDIDATRIAPTHLPGVLLDAQSFAMVDLRPCVVRFFTRLGMQVEDAPGATSGTREDARVVVHWDAAARIAKIDVTARAR